MLRRLGDAAYVFRTSFGNVTVGICSDVLGRGDSEVSWHLDSDVVAVPSYHSGSETTMARRLRQMPIYANRFVAIANGAKGRANRMPSQFANLGKRELGDRVQVDLGYATGFVSTYSVDLVENDKHRARSRKGRPLRGILPLHFDEWSADADEDVRNYLALVLQEVQKSSGASRAGGELDDNMCLDWEAARDAWKA